MTIGWAVVGTGLQVRDRIAPALSLVGGARLAAVCSRDLQRAQELAGRFPPAKAYDSYEAMLEDESVDAVFLGTPNSLHAEQTVRAALAGKHVLVEKPMALTAAEAESMIETCAARGVRLGVGFQLRHHPAHRAARQAIAQERLGKVFMVDARWPVAGGKREGWWMDPAMTGAYVMMARGVHLLDLVCYFLDGEPLSVSMMSDGQRPDRPLEETAVATLRFGDDVFATLMVTRFGASAPNGFSVYGTRGFLHGAETFGPSGTLRSVVSGATDETTFEPRNPYLGQIEDFNLAVQTGREPEVSGIDGLRVVRITEALLESARTGRTVRVK
jgi:predicted dehydrogenase